MMIPFTSPAARPTAIGMSSISNQELCVAAACTAARLATTVARPITEPTDRSMPPAVITNVTPMLITPMMEARRRMVRTLS
jgi:hypothetical protein